MSQLEILALGLLLGIRHAFDADHLVAVSTIVSEYRNPLRAIWIGVSWGLGHTTTLFIAGVVLLLLNIHIPERLALLFEFLVGIMLILLGIQAFLSVRKLQMHVHSHEHDDEPEIHEHFHIHAADDEHTGHHLGNWQDLKNLLVAGVTSISGKPQAGGTRGALMPFFRLKSFVVGIVHGLAGSAALMLIVLANIRSFGAGVIYIVLFGFGTVFSMGLISIIISLPFSISGRIPKLNRTIQIITGTFSVSFGLFLIYEVGINEGLLTGL